LEEVQHKFSLQGQKWQQFIPFFIFVEENRKAFASQSQGIILEIFEKTCKELVF
jgi:hypothetical protein